MRARSRSAPVMRPLRSLATIVAGLIVWLLGLHVTYVLVTWVGARRPTVVLLPVALAVTVAGALIAWRLWVHTARARAHDRVRPEMASFLPLAILGASLFSILAVLIGALPLLVLSPEAPSECELLDETKQERVGRRC